jgi:hypothetical protein
MSKIKNKAIDKMNKEIEEKIASLIIGYVARDIDLDSLTAEELDIIMRDSVLLALNHPYCNKFDLKKLSVDKDKERCYNEVNFCGYKTAENKCQYKEFCIYQYEIEQS